jgi:hypothetical protein
VLDFLVTIMLQDRLQLRILACFSALTVPIDRFELFDQ